MPRHVHKTHIRTKGNQAEKIQEWIKHLANASKSRVVLVEHKKDADVLSCLGVSHVYWYVNKEPAYKLLDRIGQAECILLFDVDRKSNAKCEKIKALLQEHGYVVNTRFRKFLFTIELKELGGLLTYMNENLSLSLKKDISERVRG